MLIEKIIASFITTGITSGAKAVYENSGERRRQKEFNNKINYYNDRSIFMAIAMFVIGFFFCKWMIGTGTVGLILTIVGFLVYFNELKEVGRYISVVREIVFSIISILLLILIYILPYLNAYLNVNGPVG